VSQFPRASWLRSVRRVLTDAPNDRLVSLDTRGAPELRAALADYLNRVRGACADAERVVICNGFAQAFVLVAQALRARGQTRIAVEDPGQQDDFRRVAAMLDLTIIPVPVDEEGIRVDALASADADIVVVTPAHQFPTGAVLSAERRAALVCWATDNDRCILEDDYDAEYRYDREPIGAIQGLAPEHVIYAGSASKTLAPGLRLGWMIAPDGLVDDLASIKQSVDRGSPSIEQLAFADFLARGEFDHHLRRMRPVYRARRDALLAAIDRHLPGLEPCGASAGLHVIAWLPPGLEETPFVDAAAAKGIALSGLSRYHNDPATARQGLLFGYGRVTESQIEEGIGVVASALG
jgi:GntR family transcriptional regulator/MocR family aminotransferase